MDKLSLKNTNPSKLRKSLLNMFVTWVIAGAIWGIFIGVGFVIWQAKGNLSADFSFRTVFQFIAGGIIIGAFLTFIISIALLLTKTYKD